MAGTRPSSVLFVCGLNAVRSPMAESLARRLFGKTIYIQSAGVRKGELDPFSVKAMEEVGLDISRHRPRTIEDIEENGQTIKSGLRPEHTEVFDCAFKPAKGKRSIHYMAHLSMMAAAQPFISGAISKTVNLPSEATVGDVRDAYVQAWRMGLKCVAIYRDGSKRSQPLNTKKTNEGGDKSTTVAVAPEQVVTLENRIKELETEIGNLHEQVGKPLRRKLPDTRASYTHKFDVAGHEGHRRNGDADAIHAEQAEILAVEVFDEEVEKARIGTPAHHALAREAAFWCTTPDFTALSIAEAYSAAAAFVAAASPAFAAASIRSLVSR